MSAEITIHMRRRVLSGKPALAVPLLANMWRFDENVNRRCYLSYVR